MPFFRHKRVKLIGETYKVVGFRAHDARFVAAMRGSSHHSFAHFQCRRFSRILRRSHRSRGGLTAMLENPYTILPYTAPRPPHRPQRNIPGMIRHNRNARSFKGGLGKLDVTPALAHFAESRRQKPSAYFPVRQWPKPPQLPPLYQSLAAKLLPRAARNRVPGPRAGYQSPPAPFARDWRPSTCIHWAMNQSSSFQILAVKCCFICQIISSSDDAHDNIRPKCCFGGRPFARKRPFQTRLPSPTIPLMPEGPLHHPPLQPSVARPIPPTRLSNPHHPRPACPPHRPHRLHVRPRSLFQRRHRYSAHRRQFRRSCPSSPTLCCRIRSPPPSPP